MPDPADFSDKQSFMEACVPQVLEEGTASSNSQAVAICSSMWDDRGRENMSETYERTATIRAERLDGDGVIEGTLATNGEASDGHIIDLAGMTVKAGAPLLFGHDSYSGRSNLGSWLNFQKMGPGAKKMKSLGDQQLHGTAQIEIDAGIGAQKEFRQDMAAMIGAGHITQFSVRWDADEKESPVRRVNLPSDHPAHVKDGQGRKSWGLFFPRSRLVEGSVVTLGADPQAVMRGLPGANDECSIGRILPWLMEASERLEPYQAQMLLELALEPGNFVINRMDPLVVTMADRTDREFTEDVSEPPIPPVEDAPEETPEEAPVGPIAERALEDIRRTFPEFVQEAPDIVSDLIRDTFGTMEEELREKLDDFAYKTLGRVSARRFGGK